MIRQQLSTEALVYMPPFAALFLCAKLYVTQTFDLIATQILATVIVPAAREERAFL